MGHARALVTVDDHEAQISLLRETIEGDLSVREVEKRTRAWHEAQEEDDDADDADDAPPEASETPSRTDLQLDEYRKQLRSHFSTQIQIRHKSDDEGRIEISYYSAEDLERIMDLLTE